MLLPLQTPSLNLICGVALLGCGLQKARRLLRERLVPFLKDWITYLDSGLRQSENSPHVLSYHFSRSTRSSLEAKKRLDFQVSRAKNQKKLLFFIQHPISLSMKEFSTRRRPKVTPRRSCRGGEGKQLCRRLYTRGPH